MYCKLKRALVFRAAAMFVIVALMAALLFLWSSDAGDVAAQQPDTAPTVSDTSKFRIHEAVIGEEFSLTLPAADAGSGNGGPYKYILWKRGVGVLFGENGLTFDARTRTVSGTPAATGTLLLAYQIHDADTNRGKEDSFVAETNLQITVLAPPPIPPTVSDALQFKNHDAVVGQEFTLTLPAADTNSGNGGPYEYILRKRGANRPFGMDGLSFNPETRTVSGTPTAPGTHLLTYLIHDGDLDRRTSDTFVRKGDLQITITAPVGWTAPAPAVPTVSDTSQFKNHNAAIGQTFSLTLPAADANSGNGGPYEYILWKRGGLRFGENGLKFNPETREIAGTPVVPGVFRLAYQIHDGDADRSKGDSFVAETNLQITVPSLGPESDRQRRTIPPPGPTGVEVYLTGGSLGDRNRGPDDATFTMRWDTVTGARSYVIYVESDLNHNRRWEYQSWAGLYKIQGTNQTHIVRVQQSKVAPGLPVCGTLYRFQVASIGDETTYYGAIRPGYNTAEPGPRSEPVFLTTPACVGPSSNQVPAFGEGATATRQVAENSPAGTNVGQPVTATDPDEGDTLTYSLSGYDENSFQIDPSTGQITTVASVDYDYEARSGYAVTVEATDGKGGGDSIAVTVSLTDVNEAPTFDEGATATRQVAEDSPAGTSVGAPVTATDPDDDTLTYSLSGTDAASFDIEAATGQITTVADVDYDRATKPSYAVTVGASDGNGGAASIAVTVNLTAEANAAPVFGAVRSLAENSPPGTGVGWPVAAYDPETTR